MQELFASMPQTGRVEWIGVRSGRRQSVIEVKTVSANVDDGLEGDRFSGPAGAKRQVTLIQHEHLAVIRQIIRRESLDPAMLRRNIVVSKINLLALKDQLFRIGTAVFKATGPCAPCSYMEEVLGPGGYNAMRGHGGITATVIEDGEIAVGDEVGI